MLSQAGSQVHTLPGLVRPTNIPLIATYEMIVEPRAPIPISKLRFNCIEGSPLSFPSNRWELKNEMLGKWGVLIVEMADVKREEIAAAIQREDTAAYHKLMQHVGGISTMYRLNTAALEGNLLHMKIGPTDFLEYLTTTRAALTDSAWRQKLMRAGLDDQADTDHYFSNALSGCASIVTSDGFVPIGTRSKSVAIYPEVPHVIGGYVKLNSEREEAFNVKLVNFPLHTAKELGQEVGITREELIDRMDFVGICRNTATRGPEMMYCVTLCITKDELERRWREVARDKYEHKNLHFYPKQDIPAFLQEYGPTMVPSGAATLVQLATYY